MNLSVLSKKLAKFKSLNSKELKLSLSENNLKMYMLSDDCVFELSDSVQCMSDNTFNCVVDFKEFYKIVNSFKSVYEEADLHERDNTLIMSSDDTELELIKLEDNTKEIELGDVKSSVILDSENLSSALKKTAKFTLDSSDRRFLCGVKFEAYDNVMSFCGATGHVLCLDEVYSRDYITHDVSVILPKKSCECLVSVLKDVQEDVKIVHHSRAMSFVCGSITLNTALIDGEYPCINSILFSTPTTTFEVSKDELKKKLSLLSIKNNYVMYNVKSDRLALQTKNSLKEKAQSELSLVSQTGDEYEVALDTVLVTNVIKDLSNDTVTFSCRKGFNNIMIKENKTTYVIARVIV